MRKDIKKRIMACLMAVMVTVVTLCSDSGLQVYARETTSVSENTIVEESSQEESESPETETSSSQPETSEEEPDKTEPAEETTETDTVIETETQTETETETETETVSANNLHKAHAAISDYLTVSLQDMTQETLDQYTAYTSSSSSMVYFFTRMELLSEYSDTTVTITLPQGLYFGTYDTHTNLELQKFLAAGDVVQSGGTSGKTESTLTYQPSKVASGNISPMVSFGVRKKYVVPGKTLTVLIDYSAKDENGNTVSEQEEISITPTAEPDVYIDYYNTYSYSYLNPDTDQIVQSYVKGYTDGPEFADWSLSVVLPKEAAYAAEQPTLPEGVSASYDEATHTLSFTGAEYCLDSGYYHTTEKLYYKLDFSAADRGSGKTYQSGAIQFEAKEKDASGDFSVARSKTVTNGSNYYYYVKPKPTPDSAMGYYENRWASSHNEFIASILPSTDNTLIDFEWYNETAQNYNDFQLAFALDENMGNTFRMTKLQLSDQTKEYGYVLTYTTNKNTQEQSFTFTGVSRSLSLSYQEYFTSLVLKKAVLKSSFSEEDTSNNREYIELYGYGYAPIYSEKMELLGNQKASITTTLTAKKGETPVNVYSQKREITSKNTQSYYARASFRNYSSSDQYIKIWPGQVVKTEVDVTTQRGVNPILYMVLPQGLKYIEDSISDSRPKITQIKNYDQKGSTLLTIEYYGKAGSATAFEDTYEYLYLNFTVDASAAIGKIDFSDRLYADINESYFNTDLLMNKDTYYQTKDIRDVNRNGSTEDMLYKNGGYGYLTVMMPTGSSGVYNTANSRLITDLSADAVYTVGEEGTYHFGLRSADNLSDITVYVPMGKTGSIQLGEAGTAYENDWSLSPKAGVTYAEELTDVTVSYATGSLNNIGAAADLTYSTELPSDLSKVTCIKVEKEGMLSTEGFDFQIPLAIPVIKEQTGVKSAYMAAYAVYTQNSSAASTQKHTTPLQLVLSDYLAGGYVWEDENANGKRETSEKVIADHTVKLLDNSGATVKTMKTDENGYFEFLVSALGTYSIEADPIEGYLVTETKAEGISETQNSDIDPATRRYTFTFDKDNTYYNNIGAGFIPPVTLTVDEDDKNILILTETIQKLKYTQTPQDGRSVTFVSSDPDIVQVNGAGYINARNAGEADITLSLPQLSGNGEPATETIHVSVKKRAVPKITILKEEITLSGLSSYLEIKPKLQEFYTVTYPEYAAKKSESITYTDEKGNSISEYSMFYKSGTYYGEITAQDTYDQSASAIMKFIFISDYAEGTGTVKNEEGQSIKVSLELYQDGEKVSTIYQNSDQTLTFSRIKNGTYTLRIKYENYYYDFPLKAEAGVITTDTDFVIKQSEASTLLFGSIYTEEGYSIYDAYQVFLINKGTGEVLDSYEKKEFSYGSSAVYRFMVKQDGSYQIKVVYKGDNYAHPLTVRDGTVIGEKDIYLSSTNKMGPSLNGRIIDEEEEPYQNAQVTIKKDGEEYLTVSTNSDGVYNVDDVKDGTYTISVTRNEVTRQVDIIVEKGIIKNPEDLNISFSTKVTVTGVSISPDQAEVIKGETLQLAATVAGQNNPAQTVTWSMEGNIAQTIISTEGLLSVSEEETAQTLTIRATSTVDQSQYGEAVITVTEDPNAPTTAAYQVEHYKQKLNSNKYVLEDIDQRIGNIKDTVTAEAKKYTGFFENTDAPNRISSGIVVKNGSLKLALYYDRSSYTVTFDGNGHGTGSSQTVQYEGLTECPTDITAKGYRLDGWYREKACETEWNFATDQVLKATTLYAKWTRVYEVTGDVEQGDTKVEGAKISLWKGSTQYGSTVETNEEGRFEINNVLAGTYNLKAEKGEQVVTALVNVTQTDWKGTLKLPSGKTNSVVEITAPQIKETVVGNLDQVLDEEKIVADKEDGYTKKDEETVKAGGTVEIRIVIEKLDTPASALENAIKKNKQTTGILLNMKLIKTVTDADGNPVEDQSCEMKESGGVLLKIMIPLPQELMGKESYSIFREHEGSIDEITADENTAGEYLTVNEDKTQLSLYVKKFSEYAIAYADTASEPSTPEEPVNPTAPNPEDGDTGASETENDTGKIVLLSNKTTVSHGPLDAEPKTGDELPFFPVALGGITLFMLKLMLWEYEFELGISQERKTEMIKALADWARGTTKTRAYVAVAGMAVVLTAYHIGKSISGKMKALKMKRE